jgi:hypothetical protein
MAVSLTHLSDGVTQLTAIPVWQSWAMAIGIDAMMISVALAQLTSPQESVTSPPSRTAWRQERWSCQPG